MSYTLSQNDHGALTPDIPNPGCSSTIFPMPWLAVLSMHTGKGERKRNATEDPNTSVTAKKMPLYTRCQPPQHCWSQSSFSAPWSYPYPACRRPAGHSHTVLSFFQPKMTAFRLAGNTFLTVVTAKAQWHMFLD